MATSSKAVKRISQPVPTLPPIESSLLSVEEVLAEITSRCLTVHIALGGQPSVRGPQDRMTPDLLAWMQHYRAEIVQRCDPQRLYPLIGRKVQTPEGIGELRAVLEVCWVWLDAKLDWKPPVMDMFQYWQVQPCTS